MSQIWRARLIVVGGTLLVLWGTPAPAQWAVFDASTFGQATISAANDVKTAYNTAQSVLHEAEMVKQQLAMVTNQVTNLQRLPTSIVQDVLGLGQQVSGVLKGSQGVGFDLSSSMRRFDQAYGALQGTGSSAQAFAVQQGWIDQRRAATGTAIQTQSIASDLSQRFAQLCALLGQSLSVKGNLDALQLAHQQQALAQATALQSQQMQAARDRLATQDAAEKMVLDQARLQLRHQAHQALDTSTPYNASGAMINYADWYK
jgi:P-type conjugative transfer protein TrbJ